MPYLEITQRNPHLDDIAEEVVAAAGQFGITTTADAVNFHGELLCDRTPETTYMARFDAGDKTYNVSVCFRDHNTASLISFSEYGNGPQVGRTFDGIPVAA